MQRFVSRPQFEQWQEQLALRAVPIIPHRNTHRECIYNGVTKACTSSADRLAGCEQNLLDHASQRKGSTCLIKLPLFQLANDTNNHCRARHFRPICSSQRLSPELCKASQKRLCILRIRWSSLGEINSCRLGQLLLDSTRCRTPKCSCNSLLQSSHSLLWSGLC